MEVLKATVPIPEDVVREIPVVCDWEFLESVYRASLGHAYAERFQGFIPYGKSPESGWITTRSKVELDEDNIASRRLILAHTDTPMKIAFIAIGLPVPLDRTWAHDKVIRQDSRRNTAWVQPPYLRSSLDTAHSFGSLAIKADPNKLDPMQQSKKSPISLIEVKSPQPISPKKAMRTLDRAGRLMRQTAGYKRPQTFKKKQNKYRRSFSGFSPAR